jgi:transposase-like protein
MAAQQNYTQELTQAIVADYQAGKDVAEIAEAIGKSVRSVRSKLVREGVYQAPEKPAKAAKVEGPSKKEMLNELEALAPFAVEGFMGATKEAIGALITHLKGVADA